MNPCKGHTRVGTKISAKIGVSSENGKNSTLRGSSFNGAAVPAKKGVAVDALPGEVGGFALFV